MVVQENHIILIYSFEHILPSKEAETQEVCTSHNLKTVQHGLIIVRCINQRPSALLIFVVNVSKEKKRKMEQSSFYESGNTLSKGSFLAGFICVDKMVFSDSFLK